MPEERHISPEERQKFIDELSNLLTNSITMEY